MDKVNCWEYKKCGREPGEKIKMNWGVCRAVDLTSPTMGRNGGRSAGRICWQVVGTFRCGEIQGTFAEKTMNCSQCDFFLLVKSEEGAAFVA